MHIEERGMEGEEQRAWNAQLSEEGRGGERGVGRIEREYWEHREREGSRDREEITRVRIEKKEKKKVIFFVKRGG